ncbi:MAG TPA: hypothetical protein P5164_15495 [Thermoanaerobaculia bacterium]|nr:hypothetical protein [Thermoanaerobaculia bacterium]
MRPLRLHPRLAKRSRRGFRGFPAATVAFYGPDDARATKAVVTIVPSKEADPTFQETFSSGEGDLRGDSLVGERIVAFVERHEARSVFVAEEILGCPHEEGVDYPEGERCPACPFWTERDRWAATKERLDAARGELLTRAISEVEAERKAGE